MEQTIDISIDEVAIPEIPKDFIDCEHERAVMVMKSGMLAMDIEQWQNYGNGEPVTYSEQDHVHICPDCGLFEVRFIRGETVETTTFGLLGYELVAMAAQFRKSAELRLATRHERKPIPMKDTV